jgi:hypothetical protein
MAVTTRSTSKEQSLPAHSLWHNGPFQDQQTFHIASLLFCTYIYTVVTVRSGCHLERQSQNSLVSSVRFVMDYSTKVCLVRAGIMHVDALGTSLLNSDLSPKSVKKIRICTLTIKVLAHSL